MIACVVLKNKPLNQDHHVRLFKHGYNNLRRVTTAEVSGADGKVCSTKLIELCELVGVKFLVEWEDLDEEVAAALNQSNIKTRSL